MNIINNHNNLFVPIYLGKIDNWEDYVVDLLDMQHLFISGFAGCGKSTLIHNIVSNIIVNAKENLVKLLLYDRKGVELKIYDSCRCVLIPTVSDERKYEILLNWCIAELENRLNKIYNSSARTLDEYNNRLHETEQKVPHLILVLDGYMGGSNDILEKILITGRTVGMHIILSTLDVAKSKNIINLFSSFAIFKSINYSNNIGIPKSKFASLTVGEFYYRNIIKSETIKLQTPDIDFLNLTKYMEKYIDIEFNILEQKAELQQDDTDAYFVRAGRFVIQKEMASSGMLQRAFKIGFNRAARIVDQLAAAGVIDEEGGTKARRILMTMEEFEMFCKENGIGNI